MLVTTEGYSLKYEGNLQEKDHKDHKHSRILWKEQHKKKKKKNQHMRGNGNINTGTTNCSHESNTCKNLAELQLYISYCMC